MKLDLGKLAKILGRVILAAPAIVAAVKPVVDAVKAPRKPNGQAPVVIRSPATPPPP